MFLLLEDIGSLHSLIPALSSEANSFFTMSQPEGFHLEQPEPTGSFATVCSSLRSTISYLLTPKKRFANEEQGEQRTIWGHSFTWTPEHSAPNEIHHLLYSYDKLATDALDRLDILSPPTSTNWKCHGKGSRDLYALLEQHHASDEVLGELWNQVITVPEWVDWDQLKRGQQVLYQFSGQMLLGVSPHPQTTQPHTNNPTAIL